MPKSTSVNQFHIALDLYHKHQYTEALEILTKLFNPEEKSHDQIEIIKKIGDCLCALNKIDEGIRYLEKARELSKSLNGIDDLWTVQRIADAYAKQERFIEAFSLYDYIITKVDDPDEYDYLTYEYQHLVDVYRIKKMKKIIEDKKIAFLEQIRLRIEEIENEVREEEKKILEKRQKLEV